PAGFPYLPAPPDALLPRWSAEWHALSHAARRDRLIRLHRAIARLGDSPMRDALANWLGAQGDWAAGDEGS
ncbi:MAG: hypothetical protein D6796_01760, partial [Caldilineae bacterium]